MQKCVNTLNLLYCLLFSEASNVRLSWFLDAGYLVSVKNGPHHPNPLVRHNKDLKYDVSAAGPVDPGDAVGTNHAFIAGWDAGVAAWINKGGDGQKGGLDGLAAGSLVEAGQLWGRVSPSV